MYPLEYSKTSRFAISLVSALTLDSLMLTIIRRIEVY